jgi:hypothetical protein
MNHRDRRHQAGTHTLAHVAKRKLVEGSRLGTAGVGDQHIQATKGFRGVIDECAGTFFVREVVNGGVQFRVWYCCAETARGIVDMITIARADGDQRSLFRKLQRAGKSQAFARRRHRCRLAFESQVHMISPRSRFVSAITRNALHVVASQTSRQRSGGQNRAHPL